MITVSDEERIFKDLVKVPTGYSVSVDYGRNFVRIKDPETGKIFEVKVTEKKNDRKNP